MCVVWVAHDVGGVQGLVAGVVRLWRWWSWLLNEVWWGLVVLLLVVSGFGGGELLLCAVPCLGMGALLVTTVGGSACGGSMGGEGGDGVSVLK